MIQYTLSLYVILQPIIFLGWQPLLPILLQWPFICCFHRSALTMLPKYKSRKILVLEKLSSLRLVLKSPQKGAFLAHCVQRI